MEFASLTTVVTLINIILALGFLFIERREAGYTWAWLMVLFFIPILGFVLYIFFGRNLKRRISTSSSSKSRNMSRLKRTSSWQLLRKGRMTGRSCCRTMPSSST